MKTDKEYPATHSMSTSWYFVDEEDNVAIFSFDDNGPKPDTVEEEIYVDQLCFEMPIIEKDGIKCLTLTDEQVLQFVSKFWETSIREDYYWSFDDIFQIDPEKKEIFLSYLQECREKHLKEHRDDDRFIPLCLSENLGIYMVDFSGYYYGKGLHNPFVKYLWEQHIIQRCCSAPLFEFDESEEVKNCCPYYLYDNDWDPAFPHKRVSVPEHPVKLNQLPEAIRSKVIRLKLKFSETDEIQVATHWPCYSTCCHEEVSVNGANYVTAYLPSKEKIYVLNNDGECKTEGLPLFLTEEQISKYKNE